MKTHTTTFKSFQTEVYQAACDDRRLAKIRAIAGAHDADDLALATAARLIASNAEVESSDRAIAIWHEACKNAAIDLARAKVRQADLRNEHANAIPLPSRPDNALTVLLRMEAAGIVQEAIETMLGIEHGEIFKAIALDGRTNAEVAEGLNMPIGTVLAIVSRGRDKVARYLDRAGYPIDFFKVD